MGSFNTFLGGSLLIPGGPIIFGGVALNMYTISRTNNGAANMPASTDSFSIAAIGGGGGSGASAFFVFNSCGITSGPIPTVSLPGGGGGGGGRAFSDFSTPGSAFTISASIGGGGGAGSLNNGSQGRSTSSTSNGSAGGTTSASVSSTTLISATGGGFGASAVGQIVCPNASGTNPSPGGNGGIGNASDGTKGSTGITASNSLNTPGTDGGDGSGVAGTVANNGPSFPGGSAGPSATPDPLGVGDGATGAPTFGGGDDRSGSGGQGGGIIITFNAEEGLTGGDFGGWAFTDNGPVI